MNDNLLVVYVTCPPDKADNIAETLVESKLAACVNILPVKSVYYWQGKLYRDEEKLLVIKSRREVYPKLESKIKEIHPYDVPEVIAIKAEAVQADYLKWVHSQTPDEN